jgi:Chaperone of endosialidase
MEGVIGGGGNVNGAYLKADLTNRNSSTGYKYSQITGGTIGSDMNVFMVSNTSSTNIDLYIQYGNSAYNGFNLDIKSFWSTFTFVNIEGTADPRTAPTSYTTYWDLITSANFVQKGSNGNVGIGTANPSQLLELSYSGSTGHATLFPGNRIPQIGGAFTKNYLQVQCQDASTPALGSNITLFTDATGLGPCIEYTSSYHNFLNTSGARIGYFQAALTGGTMTLSVDANGGIIRTSSDARLKNNVHDITYGLETIIQLRPVFFEWNDHKRFGTGRQVGMIAQEVRALVPEVVSACLDEIGTLSLDYVKIVPILIKSVQELSAKNTALEARIAALESK